MTTDEPKIDPITRLAAQSPRAIAGGLLFVALLCLVPVVVYGRDAFFASKAAETKPEDAPAPAIASPDRGEHVTYTLAGIVGAVIAFSLAVWTFTTNPSLGEREKITRARLGVLAIGSLL